MANVWSSGSTLKVFFHNGLSGSGSIQARFSFLSHKRSRCRLEQEQKVKKEAKVRNGIIRFLWTVSEPISGMKYAEVVNILDVALLEIEAEGELFAEEV